MNACPSNVRRCWKSSRCLTSQIKETANTRGSTKKTNQSTESRLLCCTDILSSYTVQLGTAKTNSCEQSGGLWIVQKASRGSAWVSVSERKGVQDVWLLFKNEVTYSLHLPARGNKVKTGLLDCPEAVAYQPQPHLSQVVAVWISLPGSLLGNTAASAASKLIEAT